MKTVFSNSEVAHIWARQSQDYGRNSNRSVYFDGSKIYSYGRHFCMANILKNNVVLITDRSHSVTTSAHLSSVRYAVNHMDKIFVPFPDGELNDQIKVWQDRIIEHFATLNNSRKKDTTKERARAEMLSIVDACERYCNVTGQKLTGKTDVQKTFLHYLETAKGNLSSDELKQQIDKENARKERAEKRKKAKALKQALIELEAWKKCNGNKLSSYRYGFDLPVALRVHPERPNEIETSIGAVVSVKSGKLLFDMIKAGKDVKGHTIDGYTVIGLNGVLTIGCHKIERSEIDRFAKKMKWS